MVTRHRAATALPSVTGAQAQWLSDGRIAYVDPSQPTVVRVRHTDGTASVLYSDTTAGATGVTFTAGP